MSTLFTVNKSWHNSVWLFEQLLFSSRGDVIVLIEDAVLALQSPITLGSLERVLVPTGLFMALPVGVEAQIRPRSGLAIKKGISLVNSPGTIDSDYRGEIKVIMINLSQESQIIEPKERIAQMVVAKYEVVQWQIVEELTTTGRGVGGFGSTGK